MYKSMKKTVYKVALDIGFYEGQLDENISMSCVFFHFFVAYVR